MSVITITTKLPAKELFPNRKSGKHWTTTNRVKKIDYECGYWEAQKAIQFYTAMNITVFTPTDRIRMDLQLIYGDYRHRDIDNSLAAFKALQDGIFKALNIDDSQIDIVVIDKRTKDKDNPRCVVILSKIVQNIGTFI